MDDNTRTAVPVIMLMGPPGSGKGTQASALGERYGMERIETGTLLRRMRDDPSAEARRVTERINAGHLAPPPLVAELVLREARRLLAGGRGIVFDGSPRTLSEAERLVAAIRESEAGRVLVLVLDVPKPETVNRILRRWVCAQCTRPGADGSDDSHSCRACGGQLTRRDDDTAEVMERRWGEYSFRTAPVIEYLARRGLVARVDGHRPIPDVTADVQRAVEARLRISPL